MIYGPNNSQDTNGNLQLETPYIERLISLNEEIEYLESLKPGERPTLDPITLKFITDKSQAYPDPKTQYLGNIRQASYRKLTGSRDSVTKCTDRIIKIAEEINNIAGRELYPIDYFLGYNSEIKTYEKIKQTVEQYLSSGFKVYQQTYKEGNSHLITKSEAEKAKIKKRFNKPKKELESVITLLTKKTNEYREIINNVKEQDVLREEEQLDKVLNMLFNPKAPYDLSKINFLSQNNEFPLEIVKEQLESSFGEDLVSQVFSLYNLSNAITLNPIDIQSILMGITANPRYSDLEFIVNQEDTLVKKSLLLRPNYENASSIKLSSYKDTAKLLDELRALIYYSQAHCPNERTYLNQLKKDVNLNKMSRHVNAWALKNKKKGPAFFHPANLLTKSWRNLVTINNNFQFREGTLIAHPTAKGELRCLELYSLLSEDANAILASPILSHHKGNNIELYIIFNHSHSNQVGSLVQRAIAVISNLLEPSDNNNSNIEIQSNVIIEDDEEEVTEKKLTLTICGREESGNTAIHFFKELLEHFHTYRSNIAKIGLTRLHLECFDITCQEDPISDEFLTLATELEPIAINCTFFNLKTSQAIQSTVASYVYNTFKWGLGYQPEEKSIYPKNLTVKRL